MVSATIVKNTFGVCNQAATGVKLTFTVWHDLFLQRLGREERVHSTCHDINDTCRWIHNDWDGHLPEVGQILPPTNNGLKTSLLVKR